MTLTGLDLSVRSYTRDDYDRIATFYMVVEPDYPVTASELQREDNLRDPKLKYNIFLAEHAGELIGTARYAQFSSLYHPQKFHLNLYVHPEYRRQGIGSHLYGHLLTTLDPFDPLVLRASAKEDRSESVRFCEQRGFVEEDRYWESRLDPQSFDPAPYAYLDEAMDRAGLTIQPLSTLMDACPDFQRRLYDLDWELTQDMPLPEKPTRPDWDVYRKYFSMPSFLPDAVQIARCGEQWRGFSELQGSEGNPAHLYNGFTAVGRELRGKGVATALKVKNLVWAKESSYREIKTWNSTLNAPMLAVNNKLGFVRQPAEINFKKVVKAA